MFECLLCIGPGVLPKEAIEKAQAALDNFANTGMSILEVSHRSPQFEMVVKSTCDSVKSLLQLPDNYHVLLLQGNLLFSYYLAYIAYSCIAYCCCRGCL